MLTAATLYEEWFFFSLSLSMFFSMLSSSSIPSMMLPCPLSYMSLCLDHLCVPFGNRMYVSVVCTYNVTKSADFGSYIMDCLLFTCLFLLLPFTPFQIRVGFFDINRIACIISRNPLYSKTKNTAMPNFDKNYNAIRTPHRTGFCTFQGQ